LTRLSPRGEAVINSLSKWAEEFVVKKITFSKNSEITKFVHSIVMGGVESV